MEATNSEVLIARHWRWRSAETAIIAARLISYANVLVIIDYLWSFYLKYVSRLPYV